MRRINTAPPALRSKAARAFAAAVLLLGACGQARTPAPDGIAPLAPAGVPASDFPAASRPVADVVTDTWSNEDTRDRAGEADTVMALLQVRPGMRVADVGAGSGYYTVRLSRRVGPAGQVVAQDIMPDYLRKLRDRVRREGLANVTLALGEPHDPRLPPASADLVMLVHMYHEVEQPYAFLHNLRPALRPGGRVAVVDLDRPTSRHGTPPGLLRCEFAAAGHRQTAMHTLPDGSGYLAVFTPAGAAPQPRAIRACPAPR
jgi:SAM-dependent methyltransferase